MKKNYVSPHAECMTFQADAAIAACKIVQPDWPNFQAGTSCKVAASDGRFTTDSNTCTFKIVGYCYYTHTDAMSLFGS